CSTVTPGVAASASLRLSRPKSSICSRVMRLIDCGVSRGVSDSRVADVLALSGRSALTSTASRSVACWRGSGPAALARGSRMAARPAASVVERGLPGVAVKGDGRCMAVGAVEASERAIVNANCSHLQEAISAKCQRATVVSGAIAPVLAPEMQGSARSARLARPCAGPWRPAAVWRPGTARRRAAAVAWSLAVLCAGTGDPQRLPGHAHLLQVLQQGRRHALGQVDEAVVIADVDPADVAAVEFGLVGDRADDVRRLHPVHMPDLEAARFLAELGRPAWALLLPWSRFRRPRSRPGRRRCVLCGRGGRVGEQGLSGVCASGPERGAGSTVPVAVAGWCRLERAALGLAGRIEQQRAFALDQP